MDLAEIVLCLSFLLLGAASPAQGEAKRYALLVSGLSGAPEYREKFHTLLFEARKALRERFRFAEDDVFVLGESRSDEAGSPAEMATAEIIRAKCSYLSGKVTGNDDVFVFLFGHGSFDGKNAVLNIPQKDLKDSDYADLMHAIDARTVVFINTASCSAPFIEHLSAPGRIVITATGSGTERNKTVFPLFLVEALKTEASDLDKNGEVSVFEIFQYASAKTAQWYKESNHLETEHSLLEDTGDKRAWRAGELEKNSEGMLAKTTFLLEKTGVPAASSGAGDSLFVKLADEQRSLSREISLVISQKAKYPEQEYFARLESLFVRLATINDAIEKQ